MFPQTLSENEQDGQNKSTCFSKWEVVPGVVDAQHGVVVGGHAGLWGGALVQGAVLGFPVEEKLEWEEVQHLQRPNPQHARHEPERLENLNALTGLQTGATIRSLSAGEAEFLLPETSGSQKGRGVSIYESREGEKAGLEELSDTWRCSRGDMD